MEIDDGFVEFQVLQDQQQLINQFEEADRMNKDLNDQKAREEVLEDYFKACMRQVKGFSYHPAAIAKMIDESFYLIFAYVQDTYSNSERSPDELPTRVYSISLYCSDNNNGMKKSRISSNMTENYGLIARITPSFSLNQHLSQKLQSAQMSISKILMLLSQLQTLSSKELPQDTASMKSSSRKNSGDNLQNP